jgi:CheY-like chemotaxis protein
MRVLIADDQKAVGTTLAAMVTQCGHQVVEVVSTGLEAIQAYTRHNPDIVLMDYSMPRLNGATACRNILARNPEARIILISGVTAAPDIVGSGAIAILPKPVELGHLYSALYKAGTPSDESGQSSRPPVPPVPTPPAPTAEVGLPRAPEERMESTPVDQPPPTE